VQVAAVKGMLVLTLEPNGGLAAVTAASVLQVAVVLRAYEMVRPRRRRQCVAECAWGALQAKGQGPQLHALPAVHDRTTSESGLA